jgi:hypothetical protein
MLEFRKMATTFITTLQMQSTSQNSGSYSMSKTQDASFGQIGGKLTVLPVFQTSITLPCFEKSPKPIFSIAILRVTKAFLSPLQSQSKISPTVTIRNPSFDIIYYEGQAPQLLHLGQCPTSIDTNTPSCFTCLLHLKVMA